MKSLPVRANQVNPQAPAGPDLLAATDLFGGFTEREIQGVFDGTMTEDCPAGTLLFTPDDPAERLFVLRKGCVDLYRLTPNGKRLVTRRIKPGSVFGVMGLLGQKMQGNFAETIEDSLVCMITRAQVVELLRRQPDVALRLLEVVGRRLSQIEDRLIELAYSPVRVRLAHFLLANMDPATGEIAGLSHAEIGDTIGALRHTVTETLAKLKRQGIVTTGPKHIHVRDRQRLEQLAGGGS